MVWWPLARHKLQHVCIGVTLMVPMCRMRVLQTHAHEMAGYPYSCGLHLIFTAVGMLADG